MKPILLIPVLCLCACTAQPPKRITITPPRPASRLAPAGQLRTAEQVREYRFGRYADPGDPLVMHEEHPVYRVESTARWNAQPSARARSETASSVLTSDAVLAEVNKQRAATRAFTDQAATLNQRLSELSSAAGQSQEIARQNLAIKHDLLALREKLDAVEGQLRARSADATPRPASATEDKW